MNGFDPMISLKTHIALLKMFDEAEYLVKESKGLTSAIGKIVGQLIVSELARSRKSMKHNKIWVNENPISEHRYQYSLQRRRDEFEISDSELNLYLTMVIKSVEQKIENMRHR
ncbi:hypothetical protein KZ483_24010 [Paenibacillus sp. sptzw28]|uniref:hypothetical protein n=1 Tax=Paenibacillus sp. sptzw28 TaxID=715179 RepID=UPI001C6DF4E8|nr:hypothetical protein [Paenibacillus sp. sptzw28]QYR20788.1 hypothetical protein KZ483_24010 [Paenibacillus sp. sptzw28]